MKAKWVFLLFIFIAALFGCSKGEEKKGLEKAEIIPPIMDLKKQAPPGVFLVVNEKQFKKSEFNERFEEIWKKERDKVPEEYKEEVKKSLKSQMIERLIVKTLFEEEAKRKNVTATEAEIDQEWMRLKKAFPDEKKWEEFVKSKGLKREDLATAIVINKLVDLELGSHREPTEKEIRAFYDNHQEYFTIPERAHVRHILIASSEQEDDLARRKKREKIESLRQEILKGKDFAQVAREFSDCASKIRGGDLGEIYRSPKEDAFTQAVFRQKVGEIGPVVKSPRGFHIIQVLEKKPQEKTPFVKAKGQIGEMLKQGKREEAYAQLLARLKKDAVIIKFYDP